MSVENNNIFLIDNHDEALYIWREKGIKKTILIHVDSHKDFVLEKEEYYNINIGNYLNHAFIEGMYSSMIWVIPDYSYFNLLDPWMIEDLSERYIAPEKRTTHYYLQSRYDFLPDIYISSVSNLNELQVDYFPNSVFLLDIDTDFFVNPNISYTYSNYSGKSLWLEPNEFYKYTMPLLERCCAITIAKSIWGGYTPLIYSYLSDEIYTIFDKGKSNASSYSTMRKAIDALAECKYSDARDLFVYMSLFDNMKISAHIGLLYCYLLESNAKESSHIYNILMETIPQYERYFFPIQGMIDNKEYIYASQILKKWLAFFPESDCAHLYAARVNLYVNRSFKVNWEYIIHVVSDINTQYEKSYVLMDYYCFQKDYQASIDCCNVVLHYLQKNTSPIWIGHISTLDNYRNHNVIVALIYEKLGFLYYQVKNVIMAKRSLLICKKMGYSNKKIESLLRNIYDSESSIEMDI